MKIVGNIVVGGQLEVQGYEVGSEFQRYRNDEAIIGETSDTYELVITDQGQEITCAVWIDGEITVLEGIFIDFYNLELKPIEKEYIVKLYDGSFNFVKVLPASLITNDISFSESIDAGQGELTLNVNLPIDTDYFDNVRYCRVYMYQNDDGLLIYSGWLSKMNRIYSNNKENIQATFLSLYTLLNDIYYEVDNDLVVRVEDDPANIIKSIIDYFNTLYPGILSYTEDSIDDYGESIYYEFDTMKCGECIQKIVPDLRYYLFVGADGVVHFHDTPGNATHSFTYEKNVIALTIPEDYEQVANAVRVSYGYIGGSHTGTTSVAINQESINKFGRKEKLITNNSIYGNESAEKYRDTYLEQYKDGLKNISLSVNSLYPIELIHPGDTIKIMNLGIDIDNLQVSQISYTYDKVQISLEYYTNIAQEIFNS